MNRLVGTLCTGTGTTCSSCTAESFFSGTTVDAARTKVGRGLAGDVIAPMAQTSTVELVRLSEGRELATEWLFDDCLDSASPRAGLGNGIDTDDRRLPLGVPDAGDSSISVPAVNLLVSSPDPDPAFIA